MEYKVITEKEKTDVNILNESFELFGKLFVDFTNGRIKNNYLIR